MRKKTPQLQGGDSQMVFLGTRAGETSFCLRNRFFISEISNGGGLGTLKHSLCISSSLLYNAQPEVLFKEDSKAQPRQHHHV